MELAMADNISISSLKDIAEENLVIIYVREFTEDSFQDFREQFRKAELSDQTVIPIYIDSYGGEVYTFLAMLDVIKNSKKDVATIAIGKAMSAGAFLLASGTKGYRYAAPSCSVMVHQVSDHLFGKTESLKSDVNETSRLNDKLFEFLDKSCDKALGYWKSFLKENLNADFYITPEKAKEHGMVDYVGLPTIEQRVTVKTILK